MPRSPTVACSLALLLVANLAAAQTNGPSGEILTSSPTVSSTTTSPTNSDSITSVTPAATTSTNAATTTDVPLSLWGIANSLLSSYYPSTSLTQVASLTWPTAVVIDSTTYSVHPGTTSSPTSTAIASKSTGTSNGNGNSPAHLTSDEKLGVAVGVAVGGLALAILALVMCCLWRRKRRTGSFFVRRPTPSMTTDSDAESWRAPMNRYSSFRSTGPSALWADRYNRLPEDTSYRGVGGALQPPPMAMHPAYARQYSQRSSTEDHPFYTPDEYPSREDHPAAGHDDAVEPKDFAAAGAVLGASTTRRSADPINRPPTPLLHMLMRNDGGQPERLQHNNNSAASENPFASAEDEDEEAEDIVSPIIPPTRSPERRYSPIIHYPSWSEVSEFDFTGEGRGRSIRGASSSESGVTGGGGDGWYPRRESVIGRHELA